MTDDFDDDALRDAIGSRTGGSVDLGSARTAVIGRARRVRTLRTVAIGGTAALVLVAGLLIIPNGQDRTGTPADQPDAPAPTTPTTTEAPSATTSTTTISPPSTSSTSDPITTATPSSVPLGVPASTSPQPTTVSAPVTSLSTTSLSTTPTIATTPTTSSVPVVADPPFTRRYDSPGGSITVNWSGSALSLVSVEATTGYQSEIEDQSASRIRVRFRGETDVRIEVRVEDGQVESTVS